LQGCKEQAAVTAMLDRHAAVGLLGIRQVGKTTLALEIARQRPSVYLDLMADLLLVRRLPPWAENVGKLLVRSPKVYVRDSGVVHALLGLPTLDAVLGRVFRPRSLSARGWGGSHPAARIDVSIARTLGTAKAAHL